MPKLVIAPHAGLMKRLPEHKIVGEKKQYMLEAINYIDIDGRLKTMNGNTRYNSTAVSGLPQWAKRIYYLIGTDRWRSQFAVIGGIMYKGDDGSSTFNRVPINNGFDIQLDSDAVPMSDAIEISGNVVTYLVDGTSFFKFVPNLAGEWEKINTLVDVDGNDIEPIDVVAYQDRLFILVKNRSVILFSKNLAPENFSDSTDAGLIQLPAGNGGFPQKLIVFNGFINVMHEDYFAPVTGSSAATYAVRPGDIVYGFGTRAPLSVTEIQDYWVFQNSQDNEIYQTAGTLGSTSKTPLSYPVKLGSLINPVKAHLTACVHDPNIDCLRVSYVQTADVTCNAELLYSLDEEKWAGETYGKNIKRYCLWDGAGDSNQILTLRGDTGLLMFEGIGNNVDSGPQHYRFVTGDYADNYYNDQQFTEFLVDALPTGSQNNFPLSYLLDARLTNGATEQIAMQGEVVSLGQISLGEQNVFLDRIVPLIDKSKGRMIRFLSDETVMDTYRELYAFVAIYNKQSVRVSKWTVGS